MSLVRMYRDVAARVAFQLIASAARLGEPDTRDLRAIAYEYSKNKTTKFLATAENEELSTKPTSEIVEALVDQIYNITHKAQHDNDLIETVVQILNLPFGSNVLGGKTLDALRKAVLVPEELAGLRAKLDKDERCCAGCGKTLIPGEVVTYGSTGILSRNGHSVFYCARCNMPSYIAGPTDCEHPRELTKLAIKWLKKSMQCEQCANGDKAKADEGQEVVIGSGATPEAPTTWRTMPMPTPAMTGRLTGTATGAFNRAFTEASSRMTEPTAIFGQEQRNIFERLAGDRLNLPVAQTAWSGQISRESLPTSGAINRISYYDESEPLPSSPWDDPSLSVVEVDDEGRTSNGA